MSKLEPAGLSGKSHLNLGANGKPSGSSLEAKIKQAKRTHHEAKQALDSLLLEQELSKPSKPIVSPGKVKAKVKGFDMSKFPKGK